MSRRSTTILECLEVFPDDLVNIQVGRQAIPILLVEFSVQLGAVHQLKRAQLALQDALGAQHEAFWLSQQRRSEPQTLGD
ncbi:hypothetical protein D3C78_1388430 [compost metagenome]